MPNGDQSDRDFWVALTVFGAALGTGLYALVEKAWWFGGIFTCGSAIGGLALSPRIQSFFGKYQLSRKGLWAVAVVTWLFLAANIALSLNHERRGTEATTATPGIRIDSPLEVDWIAAGIGVHQLDNMPRLVPGAGVIVMQPGNAALQIDDFIVYARNVSNININIERAYIVSDTDQKQLPMDVSSPPGKFFNLREINPVAPSTTMLFKVGLSGMNETEFEKSWSSFTAVIEYNGKTIKHSYDNKWTSGQLYKYRVHEAPIITQKR
jgi:hypothetical protein